MNNARAEEVKELLAENEVLSQQLFTARAEVAELKAKVADLEVEVTLLQLS
ncbi:MAG: hypothetical protein MJH10_15265 [Epibacterium sp.]|nr:hypothetical protein [Epibacterium sp.]